MHTLEYFAAKAKPLLDLLDAKRDEGLKRDRELLELNDEIDGIKAKLGALNTEAAEAGHLVADVHAAAAELKDEPSVGSEGGDSDRVTKPAQRSARAKSRTK